MVLKIGVIGAGAAGLCAGRHMVHFPEKYDFVIFEQTSEVGGTWNYTEKTEKDEFDLPIHSSMYKNLRTNIPKEIMGYPDFPFPNFEKSFTHHTQVLMYLKEYANLHGLYNKIKFRTYVKSVLPERISEEKRIWKVLVQEVESKIIQKYEFDAIMVCNGHFSVPNIPFIENIEKFRGSTSHSHSYREPSVFKGKTVVILGAASSGMDIAIELSSYAKKIYLSHNRETLQCKLPENVISKSGIKKATEEGFIFLDDSFVQADVLLYCTGYLYNFPFLTEQCRVKVEGNRVMPMYKHMIHMDFPEFCFIGLPFNVLPFPCFHYQVQYFLKILDKSVQLPSRRAMEEETERDYRKRIIDMKMPHKDAHKMGSLQWEYFEEIGKLSESDSLPPVYKMIYEEVEGQRNNNVMFYKKENYSLLSGEEYVRTIPEP